MLTSQQLKTRATFAYACFLAPGAAAFLSAAAPLLSPRFLEPAYLGFFMLIPLILLSALTVPVAIFLTYQIGRSEPALVALSLATPVLLIAVITESGDGILMNVAVALYGFASVGVICYWFAVRRKRKE